MDFRRTKDKNKCVVSKIFGCSTPAPYSVWRIDLHKTRLDLFCIYCLTMNRQMVYIGGIKQHRFWVHFATLMACCMWSFDSWKWVTFSFSPWLNPGSDGGGIKRIVM